MATIDIVPSTPFSNSYKIMFDDEKITTIDSSWLEKENHITVQGKQYTLYRDSKGLFRIEAEGQELAHARKNFSQSFDITYQGTHYTLTDRVRERTCILQQGDQIAGSVDPKKWSRKMEASFPSAIELPVRIFMAWLAVLLLQPGTIPA